MEDFPVNQANKSIVAELYLNHATGLNLFALSGIFLLYLFRVLRAVTWTDECNTFKLIELGKPMETAEHAIDGCTSRL
jgi:hypothetical protein